MGGGFKWATNLKGKIYICVVQQNEKNNTPIVASVRRHVLNVSSDAAFAPFGGGESAGFSLATWLGACERFIIKDCFGKY